MGYLAMYVCMYAYGGLRIGVEMGLLWSYRVTAWGFNTGGAVKSIYSHALRYHKERAGWVGLERDGTRVRSATCRRSLASS